MANYRKRTMTPSTSTPDPISLSVNLTLMREQVQRGLMDGIRTTLKVFEDLDAAERVLAAHAAGNFPHGLLHFHSNGHAPVNGNGTTPSVPAVAAAAPAKKLKALPQPRKPNRSGSRPVRGRAIQQYCLRQLAANEETQEKGLTSLELITGARASGLIPAATSDNTARMAITGNMAKLAKLRYVRSHIPATHQRSRGEVSRYWPTKWGIRYLSNLPSLDSEQTAPRMAVPAAGQEQRLTDAVISVLASSPVPNMRVRDITAAFIRDGWPEMRGKFKLSMHINWALRSLIRHGRVARHGSHNKATYRLRRPSVTVTKS